MIRMNKLLANAILATVLAAGSAHATTVTIPDPGLSPDFIDFGSGDASVTYDGVTFSTSLALSNGYFYNVGSGRSGQAAVLSSQQQTVGVANILITLPDPVNFFAMNYGTFYGGDVDFLLSGGEERTQASSGGDYVVPDVFVISESTPFTSVLLTSTDSVLNVGDIEFSTPLPPTWTMLFAGLVGLGFFAHRARMKRPGAI